MTFPRVFCFFGFIAIFSWIYPLPTSAVTTSIWEQRHQKDFDSGTPKGVSITSKGEITLSPQLVPFFTDTQEIYIWCLAEDSKGNIYAGTGNGGKIYRITPDGQSSLFYDSPEVSILSLAIDTNDNIYAGTAPSGLIYKLTEEGVPPTTILSSEEKYVWAMTFDDTGNLYAATGTNGKIYKITADGETNLLFDSEASNILCLLYAQENLHAGSDGKGIIYRITTDGAASVLYQTGQREVHTLATDAQGVIYAGTVTTAPPQPGSSGPPPSAPSPPEGRSAEEKKSHVYRIQPDGVVSRIWTAPDPLILSMVTAPDGQLLVGTGDSGKVYRVNTDGDSVSLGKCDAGQILRMHRTANTNKLLLSTGNAGKIFELQSAYIAEGTLESQAKDTTVMSRWGKLSWEGATPEGTSITFATRTGNTEKPDSTWSDWEELTVSDVSQITSPDARYIQWRAKLATSDPSATPVLREVNVASVQANIEPRFDTIGMRRGDAPDGPGESKGGGGPKAALPPSGSRASGTKYTVEWKVQDANNDTLQFNVYYKGIDETNWKLLKKELNQTKYTWDTTSMSDGRYTIKVEATDKLSNPPGMAKSTAKISDPFDIDNTQPTVNDITATANGEGTYQISCAAEDRSSYIQKAVYKIDSDEHWQVIFPGDGIFDSKREDLLLQTGELPPGEHTITIRVTDSAGNKAVGRKNF
ncbi:MAG: hypothetical protein O7E52_27005 [Candidatus Poribacteria bacterium]|nr:hypothetical protein [Candidatus Poribacteria bacterium]